MQLKQFLLFVDAYAVMKTSTEMEGGMAVSGRNNPKEEELVFEVQRLSAQSVAESGVFAKRLGFKNDILLHTW